jgi:hypothetical protein
MNLRTQFRCPHREHAPAISGGFSRRQFFSSAVGLAVGAGLSKPLGAQNGNPHVDATPKPIPGGSSPFGVPVHHFAVTPNTTPIANITEPSEITDFNGFVALNQIRGVGSGTGFPVLNFKTDVGFMVGEYVAIDGRHYNATFGFI